MKSLPIGAKETGPMWYANSREAYSCISIKVWGGRYGENMRRGKWYTYMSKVIEHSSAAVVLVFEDFMQKLNLDGVVGMWMWLDAAPYWMCHRFIGTIVHNFLSVFRIKLRLSYGLGAHFKNPCDGPGSSLRLSNGRVEIKPPINK